MIVGSAGASVGAWANALVAPNTVAATAVNITALILSLLVVASQANPSTGELFLSSRHGA